MLLPLLLLAACMSWLDSSCCQNEATVPPEIDTEKSPRGDSSSPQGGKVTMKCAVKMKMLMKWLGPGMAQG